MKNETVCKKEMEFIGDLATEQKAKLCDKKIVVIGVGGLGGYAVGELMRLPLLELVLCDGDVFSESNLDRQLFSAKSTLGKNKAQCAKNSADDVGIVQKVTAITEFFTEENGARILADADIVFDCVDNHETRLTLEKIASSLNIPIMHGAINGYVGQIAIILPNSGALSRLYDTKKHKPTQKTLPHVPATIASLQVSEAIYFLTGNSSLNGQALIIDFLSLDFVKLNI